MRNVVRDTDWPLMAIFMLGLMLRIAMVSRAGIYHPDELFQYLEQAHRLVFGVGIVPWEYRYGMRSWLLPLLIAPPMALGDVIAPRTPAYLLLPRLLAACASMTIVWAAWSFGRQISRAHGLIAATIAAIWGEFVYLAPHLLSESLSIALILPAAAMLTDGRGAPRTMIAGALLGLALILRIQHGPAVAVLIWAVATQNKTALRPVLIGGGVALIAGAAIDLAMGQPPFGWATEYIRQNIGMDRAAAFGTAPAQAYAAAIGVAFGWWTAPMFALAAIGARRQPVLLPMALINLALHMAIAHKEYRFILLTTALITILAAIGTGDVVAKLATCRPMARLAATTTALLFWASASASLANHGSVAGFAMPKTGGPELFADVGRDSVLCGLAMADAHFSGGGGYTYLHRAVPLYSYESSESDRLRHEVGGFNRLIAPRTFAVPSRFTRTRCMIGGASLCLYARPGDCRPIQSPAEINRKLVRLDQ